MTLNGHTRFKVEFLAFFYPSVFFHVWKCFINVLPLACLPAEITFVRPLYIRLFSVSSCAVLGTINSLINTAVHLYFAISCPVPFP